MPATTRIRLVRHGAHDQLGRVLSGRGPVGLNAAGRAQARALGAALAVDPPDAVYASPLPRAQQTAGPIAAARGLPVVTEAALDEIDFGAWTGVAFDQLDGDPAWQAWNTARLHHRPPGGESMLHVQMRIANWMGGVAGNVVAVSHGDVIKAACCHALGLSIDHHARFDIDPASVTTILAGPWGLKLVRLNS